MVSAPAARISRSSDPGRDAVRVAFTAGRRQRWKISLPDGKREIFSSASSPLAFADTFQSGFYTFKSAGRAGRFAVNLFDEEESQIAPRASLRTAAQNSSEAAATTESGFSLWPVLLGVVLAGARDGASLGVAPGLDDLSDGAPRHGPGALALALFNPRIFSATTALDVILGVDLSRSVGQEGREKALEILAAAGRLKTPNTRTGLLTFGRAPEWESLPREQMPRRRLRRAPGSRPDRHSSRAASGGGSGRRGASGENPAAFRRQRKSRRDRARDAALARQGVEVWTLPVGLSRGRNEIYLSDLTLPRQVDSAEGFEIHGVDREPARSAGADSFAARRRLTRGAGVALEGRAVTRWRFATA